MVKEKYIGTVTFLRHSPSVFNSSDVDTPELPWLYIMAALPEIHHPFSS